MIPEAAYVILASSGIGAVHSVVFAKVSAQSLNRIADVQSALIVNAIEGLRGEKVMALKSIIDAAIADLPFLTTCLVFRRTDAETARTPVRDVWANEKTHNKALPPSEDDFLFMLYTSGSTGKPRGMHTPRRRSQ